MIVRLTLTEDHLKLIPFFFLQEIGDTEVSVDSKHLFLLGSHLLEDMAAILGLQDKVITASKNDIDGAAYVDEAEEYMLELYQYIKDNLYYIETLIHQFIVKGGLTVGTYKAFDNELIWEKEN